jgi:UDP-glucuronate 4-epimerase
MGCSVIGLDNFNAYYDVKLKQDRASILEAIGVPVVLASVEDKKSLCSLIEQHDITHIIHLAAQAGVRYSLQDPDSYLRSNIDGFVSVLEAARAFPSIVTVWASSSSVYGTNQQIPFSESHVTDTPTNLYGATKKSNELMAHAYFHLFGIKLIGLRFFTVYGPWGRPDMAYYLFADKIMNDEQIEIYGHGALRRDFTYVDDIVDGIIAAMSAPCRYGIYNLGNCHAERVDTLLQYIEEALGKKARVIHVDRRHEDMLDTWADISLAQKDLGFSPKVSLREGINHFVEWYLNYREKKLHH